MIIHKYNSHGKKGCGAPFFSVSQSWLESKVMNEINKFKSDKLVDRIYNNILEKYSNQKDSKEEVEKLNKLLNTKAKEQQNLLESLRNIDATQNNIAVKVIADELNLISKQIESIKEEINDYESESLQAIPSREKVKKSLEQLDSLLAHSSINEKREIIWMFIKSITLDPIERSVTAEFQFDAIRVLLEKAMYRQNSDSKKQKTRFGSSTELVAGVRFELTTFGL